MRLIFLYGLPATGKLTVAQELSKRTNYKLFHNHLVVDLLLSTFEFGSAPFVELRENIWLSVFDQASRSELPGLIFTFAPETTVRRNFIEQTIDVVTRNGGEVNFVELVCPIDELKHRMDSPSRLRHQKLVSFSQFEKLHASGEFDASHMPRPSLTIDTSLTGPSEAAARISDNLKIVRPRGAVAAGV